MLSFFPRGVLDEILNLIELVSEGFPSYFCKRPLVRCLSTCSKDFFSETSESILMFFANADFMQREKKEIYIWSRSYDQDDRHVHIR